MILFFGPAGSGKSAQAQLLVDNNNWKWLSVGQLLRDSNDSEIHEFQKKGLLVPVEKVNQVLGEALDKIFAEDKLIIDGYPRQMNQAEWLFENCKLRNLKIDLAIIFDVNTGEVLKRIKLRGRNDDTQESINSRLSIFHKEIDPILDFMSGKGIKVVHIDGIGTFEEVHERVMEELKLCKLG